MAGEFDEAPVVIGPMENAGPVLQRVPFSSRLEVAPGAVMTAPPLGTPTPIDLALNDDGRITRLEPAADDGENAGSACSSSLAPTATTPWIVSIAADHALTGSGFPEHRAHLAESQVSDAAIDLLTVEPAGWQRWDSRADLDASGPHDRHFTLDAVDAHHPLR